MKRAIFFIFLIFFPHTLSGCKLKRNRKTTTGRIIQGTRFWRPRQQVLWASYLIHFKSRVSKLPFVSKVEFAGHDKEGKLILHTTTAQKQPRSWTVTIDKLRVTSGGTVGTMTKPPRRWMKGEVTLKWEPSKTQHVPLLTTHTNRMVTAASSKPTAFSFVTHTHAQYDFTRKVWRWQ